MYSHSTQRSESIQAGTKRHVKFRRLFDSESLNYSEEWILLDFCTVIQVLNMERDFAPSPILIVFILQA